MDSIRLQVQKCMRTVVSLYASPHRYASLWFARGVGLMALLAFWSLLPQVRGLMGEVGLVPLAETMAGIAGDTGTKVWFWYPSVFWLIGAGDMQLVAVTLLGAAAGFALFFGWRPWWAAATALVCYQSFCQVDRLWLELGSDALLSEALFLSLLLLTPGWKRLPTAAEFPARPLAIFLLNLLVFKVLFGSGIAKLQSPDGMWRQAVSLLYFFETQPSPTALAWWFHVLPGRLPIWMAWFTMFVLLAVPFYMFLPQVFRRLGAVCIFVLGAGAFLSGNRGILFPLLVVCAFSLVNDQGWRKLLPRRIAPRALPALAGFRRTDERRRIAQLVMLLVWIPLMVPVGKSFGPWEGARSLLAHWGVCNQYPLHPDVQRQRIDLQVQGSQNGRDWHLYALHYQPSHPTSALRFSGVHTPRLELALWEAAQRSHSTNAWQKEGWYFRLMEGLVQGNPYILNLFQNNPFPDSGAKFVRVMSVRMRFSHPGHFRTTGERWSHLGARPYGPVIRSE